jgi:cellulose synthase/poly-beta-1,6-N-acetylglucosamine synthase-like glycosyltransferase
MFGYPLLVTIWSRVLAQPVKKSFIPRTVSILLPVHNGERWLAEKLRSIRELDYPQELLTTIIISSASTDATLSIAKQHAGPHVEVIEVQQPGKARALNAGLAAAKGEILFLTDVRQFIEPESLKALIEHFADPRVGAVSGELVIREGNSLEEAAVGLYWKYEKLIRKAQSQIDSVPGATGAIYAVRRDLTRTMPEGTLLDDVYLPMCAFRKGYRLTWEPDAKAYDYPSSLKTEFVRKVRTLAGVYQITWEFPWLLIPNHRLWLHYVSHKIGRLMIPYLFIMVLVSSFWLPSPWMGLLLGAQAVGYGLAFVNSMIGGRSPLKRLSSPAGTFVMLMAAAVCAVSIFFVPADRLWKPTR